MAILLERKWVQKIKNTAYRLTPTGIKELKIRIKADKADFYPVAAYGVLTGNDLRTRLDNGGISESAQL